MSKNLTRKGYALGALVALAASVFAGAPAYAADTVVLAANYSTDKTLAVPVTDTIELNASLAPGSTAANIAQLTYKIVTDATFVAEVSISGAKLKTGTLADGYTAVATNGDKVFTKKDPLNTGVGVQWLLGASTDATRKAVTTTYVKPVTTPDATAANLLKVGINAVPDATTASTGALVSTSDATRTVTVTAFIDSNLNGVLDTGEAAQEQVISFVKYSAITATTTITAPIQGDTSVIASVKFTNINNQAIATSTRVGAYFSTGTDGDLSATFSNVYKNDATYSTTTGAWKFTTGTVTALAKDSAVKVQPLLGSGALSLSAKTDVVNYAVGTAATLAVSNQALSSLKANFVKSTTASAAATAGTSVTQDVAVNTEKQVYFIAKDTTPTTPVAKAGAAVKVTVTTSATLSATKTLTVNGTTYTSNASLPGATAGTELALTTDAAGKAIITYKTVGYTTTSGNATVKFAATAENFSADATGTEVARDFTGATTYIANSEGDKVVTTDGTAVNVDVVVQDQFGGAAPDATYSVTASFASSTQATTKATADSDTFKAVVGGKATLTILDNGTGVGTNVYAIDLREVAANGVLSGSKKAIASTFTIVIATASNAAAAKVAIGGNTAESATALTTYTISAGYKGGKAAADNAPLTYSDFGKADLRGVVGTAPLNQDWAEADVAGVEITGTISSAVTATDGGSSIPSAAVTVSGTGLQFSVSQDNQRVYSDGSLSFVAKADGTFTIWVWGHLSGKQTVTIKSGTGTATVYVYFADAAAISASTVTAVVADGAAQFQAGRALDVTFKVTDKFGNPVVTAASGALGSLTIAQTGAGYLLSSGTVTTSATGAYSTKLITNFGDLGTSTITATLDLTTDVVRTVSSEFGVTDADVTVGGRAVYASVEFAKGKTVTVSVDGKRLYSKLFSTDAYTELKFTQKKAGKHTVTVRISGGVVYSEVVTTTK